jgi:hypothetical protein
MTAPTGPTTAEIEAMYEQSADVLTKANEARKALLDRIQFDYRTARSLEQALGCILDGRDFIPSLCNEAALAARIAPTLEQYGHSLVPSSKLVGHFDLVKLGAAQ